MDQPLRMNNLPPKESGETVSASQVENDLEGDMVPDFRGGDSILNVLLYYEYVVLPPPVSTLLHSEIHHCISYCVSPQNAVFLD